MTGIKTGPNANNTILSDCQMSDNDNNILYLQDQGPAKIITWSASCRGIMPSRSSLTSTYHYDVGTGMARGLCSSGLSGV